MFSTSKGADYGDPSFSQNSFFSLKRKRLIPIITPTSSDKILAGEHIVIIGGSGGIGHAMVGNFIKAGAFVIATGTNANKLENLKKSFPDVQPEKLDISNFDSFNIFVDTLIRKYKVITSLVIASGIHTTGINLNMLTVAENEYDKIFDVNMKGPYFLVQKFAKYFIKNKIKAHILLINSQSSLEPGWSPYRLSKAALESFTKGAAQQLIRYGIIVNAIGPGPTATSMQNYCSGDPISTDQTPLGRYVMPEEIATYATLLISKLGDSIIGQTLYMSGGRGIINLK